MYYDALLCQYMVHTKWRLWIGGFRKDKLEGGFVLEPKPGCYKGVVAHRRELAVRLGHVPVRDFHRQVCIFDNHIAD